MALRYRVFGDQRCGDLEGLLSEINQLYLDRLRKIEELDDPLELKAKLLHLWVTDLLEQNQSLAETFGELEDVATQRVLYLEEQLRKPHAPVHPVQECVAQIPDPDGHTLVSLRALAKRLEVDVRSLLELIRRVRTQDSWDVKGLVFHEVSYSDIFGKDAPPPARKVEMDAKKVIMDDKELHKLKMEVEFWKTRAETGEAEAKKMQTRECQLLKELDQARRMPTQKREVVTLPKDPEPKLLQPRDGQLGELLSNIAGLEQAITLAGDSLQKLTSQDIRQIVGTKKHLLADLKTATGRIQQLTRSVAEEFKSIDEQHPAYPPGTCMFDNEKMVAFQKHKAMNLTNYFVRIQQDAKDLENKFREPDPKVKRTDAAVQVVGKDEEAVIEEIVRTFILAVCKLMDEAKEVKQLVKETVAEVQRHDVTRAKNIETALKEMQLQGQERSRVDALQVSSTCYSPESLMSHVELYEKKIRVQDNIIVRLQVIEERVRKQYDEAVKCSRTEVRQLVHDRLQKRDFRLAALDQQLSFTKSRIQQLEDIISSLSNTCNKPLVARSPCSPCQCEHDEINNLMMAGIAETPILLTALLSSKLDATRNQANVQQEKINVLQQSISEVSQHMKGLRKGTNVECNQWWVDSQVEVLKPVRCWSSETFQSEDEEALVTFVEHDELCEARCQPQEVECDCDCSCIDPDIEMLIPKLRALTIELSSIQAQLEDMSNIYHDIDPNVRARDDLPIKVVEMTRQLEKTEAQMKVHEEIIAQLKCLCMDYEATVKGLENTIKRLMGDVSTKVTELARQVETTNSQMRAHEEIISQLRGLCVDYRDTIKYLESTINALLCRQPQREPYDAKMVRIHGQMGERMCAASEVDKLKQQLETTHSQLQAAQKEIANQEEIIAIMADSARVHNSMIKELERRIQAQSATHVRQETVPADQKKSLMLQKELEACEHQNKLLQNNEKVVESKLANLQAQADNLCQENKVLQEQLCASTLLTRRLEESVQEWTKCTEELRAVNAKQEVMLSELEQARQDLMKQLELALEHQQDGVRKVIPDKAASTERLAGMACRIANLEAEVEMLRRTVKDKENELKAVRKATNKEVEPECDICSLQNQLQASLKTIAERDSTICLLKDEVQCLREKLCAQVEQLNLTRCATTKLTQLENEVRCLQKKLNEANKRLLERDKQGVAAGVRCVSEVQARQRTAGLEEEKSILRRLCSTVHTSRSTTRVRSPTGLKRVVSEYVRVCSEETLKKQMVVRTSVLARAEEEICSLKSQVVALKKELETYRCLNTDYQQLKVQADAQALQQLNVQLQTWVQQNASLQAEVQMLRKNNERLALDLRLAQKALQDTASAASSSQRRYSKDLQELAKVNQQLEATVRRLRTREDQLQAEVTALEASRVAVAERNALLEKSTTHLLKELENLKMKLCEHDRQISVSEERSEVIGNQVRDCQQLVTLMLEQVRNHKCSAGRPQQADAQVMGIHQHVQLHEGQQQKLLSVVAMANSKLQQGDTDPGHSALQSIMGNLLQDLERTAALNLSLQQSLPLVSNTGMPKITKQADQPKDSDKDLSGLRKKVADDASEDKLAAWQQERERLLAQVARLKKLHLNAMSKVTMLSDQLSSATLRLQSSQSSVVSLTKERNQLVNEVINLKAAYHKLRKESDAAKWVVPASAQEEALSKDMYAEREMLLQKLAEFQHVNAQLCGQVEWLEDELQALVPTRDRQRVHLRGER